MNRHHPDRRNIRNAECSNFALQKEELVLQSQVCITLIFSIRFRLGVLDPWKCVSARKGNDETAFSQRFYHWRASNNERPSEGTRYKGYKTLGKEYLIAVDSFKDIVCSPDFWRRDTRDSTNMETQGSLFAVFTRIKMNLG